MDAPDTDKRFAGSIPLLYENYLVPLIFEPYAEDLARRLEGRPLARVLEIAAGTGVVTRRLAAQLPASVDIVATDLNEAMLAQARATGSARPVTWRQADAMSLPFADASFDAVVCQFGLMFFPDKARALAEARRVLAPGGMLAFNVWDRIEENAFAATVTMALEAVFPKDPPRFLARTPHGYHAIPAVMRDIEAAGFAAAAQCDTVAAVSRAPSARVPAIAYCQGTPLRNEIEARSGATLQQASDIAEAAIARVYGNGAVAGKIQAHVFVVAR